MKHQTACDATVTQICLTFILLCSHDDHSHEPHGGADHGHEGHDHQEEPGDGKAGGGGGEVGGSAGCQAADVHDHADHEESLFA